MKILLLGGSGLIGSDCKEVLSQEYEVISPSSKELDIVSWDMVIENLQKIKPNIIINCAGFTDVDACEKEEYLVKKVNVEGPRNLAQGAARFNCRMVHISTDYVFSGQKTLPRPYFEDDPIDPISAYGRSKVESEVAIKENSPNYIIMRTGWLYGKNRDNFINSIIKGASGKAKSIKVFEDQFGSPTWTYRLALQILELLHSDIRGTFHATSEGSCSRLECAEYIIKQLKIKTTLKPVSVKSHHFAAKRPVNCILENRLLKKAGLNIMPEWKDDLDLYLNQYGKDIIKESKAKSAKIKKH
ncbi:MAG: dTDP-4-dehydrorhamnose reductase [Deltaproteobacteria bacterium]|nr:dTDP-4-dehydrorhamnose reductase [Deltaproteobacteria bacterium]